MNRHCRCAAVVAFGVLATMLAGHRGVAMLPLRGLLKDELGASPGTMAAFLGLCGLAWYLKPLAGLASDHFPIFGTRRRHYLLISAFAAAAAWTAAAFVPRTHDALLVAMIAVNVALVLANTALGGLLIDQGRAHGMLARFSSLRVTMITASALLAGPIGGWLAGGAFGLTCTVGAALMLAFGVAVLLLVGEAPARSPDRGPGRMRAFLQDVRARRFWAVALLCCSFYATPGFASALYYHQKDVLGLGDPQIGVLLALNSFAGIVGAFCYPRLSRFGLRALLRAGIGVNAGCSLLYLAYQDLWTAVLVEAIAGFLGVFGLLSLQHLTARASPAGHEALGYALLLGLGNVAITASDLLGTLLMARFGLGLQGLFVVSAASIASTVLLVRLVPPALLTDDQASL